MFIPTTTLTQGVGEQELAYVEFTSTVNCTATSAAAADTIVTAPPLTFAGNELLLIAFSCPTWSDTLITSVCNLNIWESSTDRGMIWRSRAAQANQANPGIYAVRRLTPTAGTYSFTMRGWVTSASTFALVVGSGGAGIDLPGFIRIVRIATG